MIKIEMYPVWNELELGIVTQHSFMLWYNTPILNQMNNIKIIKPIRFYLSFYLIL